MKDDLGGLPSRTVLSARSLIALKEAKKLADDMGDYQTLGFKESLVYTVPKDLF